MTTSESLRRARYALYENHLNANPTPTMDTTSVNHHRGKPRYHPRLSPEVVLTRAASPPYLVTPPAGATACLSSPDSDDIATPPGGNLRVSQYSTASDQERFYAAASSSSAESFETIATPWSRLSQVINPEVHPLTHNEVRASAMDPAMFSEDNHRAVRSWTARRGVKGSFWGTGSDSTTSPPIPTRSLPNAPARVSMRSQSPDSTYTASSSMSAAPRSSSESCVRSTPAARARVPSAPVRHYDDDHLLAPPAPSFTSGHPEVRPNSPDSFTTVTGSPNASPNASPRSGRLSLRLPRLRKTPSSTSLGESSPVARTRRLNALRNLVPNLNFVDQPWSVTDRGESEEIDDSQFWVPTEQPGNADEEEELAPQLDRLSLGSKFQVDAVCRLNQSTSSLPLAPTCTVTKSEKRRTLRNSRSMVSLKSIKPRLSDDDDNSRPVWRLRAASPSTSPPNSLPMDWTFPMPRKEASAPALSTNTSKHLTPDAVPKLARPITPGAHTRKQSSITRAQYVRELPRPLLKRKESFNIESSGYTKSINPLTPRPVLVPTTWRESLSEPGIYTHILIGPDGPNEVKRQEVMWEMGETEYAFLRACRSVNHLFANPLRHAGGWMPGIPTSVCDMFEALEVITYTHQDLSKAQQLDRRSADILDVSSFVAQFRAWVERLACHQPFVVLFNRVTKIIEDATRDPEGPFGAFVRMQMSDKALGSMTLGSMLLQPVQRLTKYPLFLKRLLNATPVGHPAHNDVLELLETTKSVLDRLEECKAREDDFQALCSLEDRIDGLPIGFELAVRGRRLVGHAQVARIHRDPAHGGAEVYRSGSLRGLRAAISSTVRQAERPGTSLLSSTPSLEMADPFSPEPSRATSRAASRASRSPSDVLPDRSAHPPSAIQRTASLTSGVQPLRKRQQREPFTLLVFNDLVLLLGAHKDRTSVFKVRKERPRFRAVSASEGGVGTVDSVRETKDAATGDRAFALAVRAPRPAPLGAPSHASFVLVPPAQRVRPAPELGPALDTIEGTLAVLVAARREREADSGEWDLC